MLLLLPFLYALILRKSFNSLNSHSSWRLSYVCVVQVCWKTDGMINARRNAKLKISQPKLLHGWIWCSFVERAISCIFLYLCRPARNCHLAWFTKIVGEMKGQQNPSCHVLVRSTTRVCFTPASIFMISLYCLWSARFLQPGLCWLIQACHETVRDVATAVSHVSVADTCIIIGIFDISSRRALTAKPQAQGAYTSCGICISVHDFASLHEFTVKKNFARCVHWLCQPPMSLDVH